MANIGIINPAFFPPRIERRKINVRQDVESIISTFQFEFMSPKVTHQIAYNLSLYFEKEVKDATTNEMRDRGEFSFDILHNDNIYNLFEYIIYLESIERRDKILKIKQNIWRNKRNY